MFYSTSELNDLTQHTYYTTVSSFPSAAVTVVILLLLYPTGNERGSLNYHSDDD